MYTYCRHIAYRAILPAACSLLVLLLASSAVYGQRRFYMQAPASVNQGQSFELTIVLENIEGTVTPPKLDAFVVLANSSFKEIGIVNGSMTRVTKETYQLLAKTIGQHNLGTAQLVAKGTTYQSNALSIKVTALSAAQKQQAQQQQDGTSRHADKTALDASHTYKAHILREACVGKGVKNAANKCAQAVHPQAGRQLFLINLFTR